MTLPPEYKGAMRSSHCWYKKKWKWRDYNT